MSYDNHKSRLEEKLFNLKTDKESLESQLLRLEEQVEIHKSENVQLKETNYELVTQNKLFSERIEQLTNQLQLYENINDQLDVVNSANMDLNQDITQFRNSIQTVKSENQILTDEIVSLKSSKSQLESQKQIAQTHKQIQLEQQSKIKELEDNVQILQSHLNTFQTAFPNLHSRQMSSVPYTPILKQNKTLKLLFDSPNASPNEPNLYETDQSSSNTYNGFPMIKEYESTNGQSMLQQSVSSNMSGGAVLYADYTSNTSIDERYETETFEETNANVSVGLQSKLKHLKTEFSQLKTEFNALLIKNEEISQKYETQLGISEKMGNECNALRDKIVSVEKECSEYKMKVTQKLNTIKDLKQRILRLRKKTNKKDSAAKESVDIYELLPYGYGKKFGKYMAMKG